MKISHDALGYLFVHGAHDLDFIRNCRLVCRDWEKCMGKVVKNAYGEEHRKFNRKLNEFLRFIKRMEEYDEFQLEYAAQIVGLISWCIKFYWKHSEWRIYPIGFQTNGEVNTTSIAKGPFQVSEKTKEEIDRITKFIGIDGECDFHKVQSVLRKLLHYETLLCAFWVKCPNEEINELNRIAENVCVNKQYVPRQIPTAFVRLYKVGAFDVWASHCVQNILRKSTCTFADIERDAKGVIFSYFAKDLDLIQTTRRVCKKWKVYIDREVPKIYGGVYDNYFSKLDTLFSYVKEIYDDFVEGMKIGVFSFAHLSKCGIGVDDMYVEFRVWSGGLSSISIKTDCLTSNFHPELLSDKIKNFCPMGRCNYQQFCTYFRDLFHYNCLKGIILVRTTDAQIFNRFREFHGDGPSCLNQLSNGKWEIYINTRPKIIYDIAGSYCVQNIIRKSRPTFADIPKDIKGLIFSYAAKDLDLIQTTRRVSREWKRLVDIEVVNVYQGDHDAFYSKADKLFAFMKKIFDNTLKPITFFNFYFDYIIPVGKDGEVYVEYNRCPVQGNIVSIRFKEGTDPQIQKAKEICGTVFRHWGVTILSRSEGFTRPANSYDEFWKLFYKLFTYDHLGGQIEITCEEFKIMDTIEKMGFNKQGIALVDGMVGVIHDSPLKNVWASHCVSNIIRSYLRFPFQKLPSDTKKEIFSYAFYDLELLKKFRVICKEWRDQIDSRVCELYTPFYEKFYTNAELLFELIRYVPEVTYRGIYYRVIIDSQFSIVVYISSNRSLGVRQLVIDLGNSKSEYDIYIKSELHYRKILDKLYADCGIEKKRKTWMSVTVDVFTTIEKQDVIMVLYNLFNINSMRTKIRVKCDLDLTPNDTVALDCFIKATNGPHLIEQIGFDSFQTIDTNLSSTDQFLCKLDDGFYMPRVLSTIVKRKFGKEEEERKIKPRIE